MSLLYAWWKRYYFHDFQMFFIIFGHANACASMHLLVEIHNKWDLKSYSCPGPANSGSNCHSCLVLSHLKRARERRPLVLLAPKSWSKHWNIWKKVFPCFRMKNHRKKSLINQKVLNGKKVFWPAFGCMQHPKACLKTQHLLHKTGSHKTYLKKFSSISHV